MYINIMCIVYSTVYSHHIIPIPCLTQTLDYRSTLLSQHPFIGSHGIEPTRD